MRVCVCVRGGGGREGECEREREREMERDAVHRNFYSECASNILLSHVCCTA